MLSTSHWPLDWSLLEKEKLAMVILPLPFYTIFVILYNLLLSQFAKIWDAYDKIWDAIQIKT